MPIGSRSCEILLIDQYLFKILAMPHLRIVALTGLALRNAAPPKDGAFHDRL